MSASKVSRSFVESLSCYKNRKPYEVCKCNAIFIKETNLSLMKIHLSTRTGCPWLSESHNCSDKHLRNKLILYQPVNVSFNNNPRLQKKMEACTFSQDALPMSIENYWTKMTQDHLMRNFGRINLLTPSLTFSFRFLKDFGPQCITWKM